MAVVATLQDRYAEVTGRIADAAHRAGRDPAQIILVAVTKYAQPEQIKALLEMGHRDLGENQVPQLVQRAAMMDEFLDRLRVLESTRQYHARAGDALLGASAEVPDSIRWHMIGHLQRNKARKVVGVSRLIHSVDSLRLAEELQAIGQKHDRVIEVLLQVNLSGEASKFGCPVPAVMALAEQIETIVHVRLRGMMTMAPLVDDSEDARPVFARGRELFDELAASGIVNDRFNILSMGMSNDYEVAIEEGANIVRVGSAIFGPREG